jgi:hypothetical protein
MCIARPLKVPTGLVSLAVRLLPSVHNQSAADTVRRHTNVHQPQKERTRDMICALQVKAYDLSRMHYTASGVIAHGYALKHLTLV